MSRIALSVATIACAFAVVSICGCDQSTSGRHAGSALPGRNVGGDGDKRRDAESKDLDSSPNATDAPKSPSKIDPKAAAAVGVTLEVIDPKGLSAFLEEQRGKVVLIDYWATWCIPCLRDMPHAIEMHHKYADKGFVAVTMCMMEPEEDTKLAALEKLVERKAVTPNFMSALGGEEEAFEAFDIVNVPHYKVFDRDGKLVRDFTNLDVDHPVDYTDVEAEVKKQLGL